LIEDILLILIVFILTVLIFVLFFLIILIAVSNILMPHSEHILVLLLSVLSELLLFAIIFLIITVHLLVLIDSSLGLKLLLSFLLKLSFVESFLGFLFSFPLLFDLLGVFKEGQRMN